MGIYLIFPDLGVQTLLSHDQCPLNLLGPPSPHWIPHTWSYRWADRAWRTTRENL